MAMRVLVTGGTGDVGRATVGRLVARGHPVTVIGRTVGISVAGARYAACDVTDSCSLEGLARDADAIVHLAAYSKPMLAPSEEIFRVNAYGTFCVFGAAAAAGIRRVVCASSINALGFNYGIRDFPLRYFPVDEEHPGYTTDAYSFSKQVTESVAEYFARREGIDSVCLRFPWVAPAPWSEEAQVRAFARKCREALEELLCLSLGERRRRVEGWLDTFAQQRADRLTERYADQPPWGPLMKGRSNFWTILDERDAAQAIERSLSADLRGSHALYVCDSHNSTGLTSETLAELFFPEVRERRAPLAGTESLVSIARARALIGFEPEFSADRWLRSAGTEPSE